VIIKPSPPDLQELLPEILAAISIDSSLHDIALSRTTGKARALGAGLGVGKCWCDGVEVSQFTISSRSRASNAPVAGELTYEPRAA
jgi:glycyl-tRNA synthetase alpha subunit